MQKRIQFGVQTSSKIKNQQKSRKHQIFLSKRKRGCKLIAIALVGFGLLGSVLLLGKGDAASAWQTYLHNAQYGPPYHTQGPGAPWGVHDTTVLGMPRDWSWTYGAYGGDMNNPGSKRAIQLWGQVAEADPGSPSKDIRAHVREVELWIRSGNPATWKLVEDADGLGGGYYTTATYDSTGGIPMRNEPDGGQSFAIKDGNWAHFWTNSWPRVPLPVSGDSADIQGVHMRAQMRLIGPGASTAKYLANVSADYYLNGTSTGDYLPGLLQAKLKYMSADWQWFVASTLTPEQIQQFPPPPPAGFVEGPPDVVSPTVSLNAPTNGTTVSGTHNLVATASDNVGVGRVEFYSGSTKIGADDTTAPYEVTWNTTTTTNGSHVLTAKAYDTSGNSTTSSPVTVTVNNPVGMVSSIWPASVTPSVVAAADTAATELGLKFRTDVSGQIKGVRFYKAATNTGNHVGSLWSSAGTRLASVTFINETTSGWQQALFTTPVNVTAGTTYIVSYHAPNGRYSANTDYFSGQAVVNSPLRALQSGIDGANGVYKYGPAGSFPNESFQNTNYWVDVVFAAGTSTTPPPPSPTMPGDVNGDGIVNGLDLSTILTNYGKTNQMEAQGDVNGDGLVNGLDLSRVLTNYGI